MPVSPLLVNFEFERKAARLWRSYFILRRYLRIEIMIATSVPKAIIKESDSYVVIAITSLKEGGSNLSDYPMRNSIADEYVKINP